MTPNELRIRCAEIEGIACERCNGTGKYKRFGEHDWFRECVSRMQASGPQPFIDCDHVTPDERMSGRMLPAYDTDLNTINAAVLRLSEEKQAEWIIALSSEVNIKTPHSMKMRMMFNASTASALDRATAFAAIHNQ